MAIFNSYKSPEGKHISGSLLMSSKYPAFVAWILNCLSHESHAENLSVVSKSTIG